MTVLVGGSGSVGSTLLAAILNRHSKLFCGPELSIFNKEIAFTDWATARQQIRSRPEQFITWGWGPYSGSDLLHSDYHWSERELHDLLASTNSIVDFANRFFARPLTNAHKSVWVEKTPSNSLCFSEFLESFENARTIHMTRNPQDSVASLVRRGFTPIYATGIWVYNCAMGLRSSKSERYHEIKYENLTENPARCLGLLTDFLGVKFEDTLLSNRENVAPRKHLDSWSFVPDGEIRSSKVGSFERMSVDIQSEILTSLSVFRISEKHNRKYDLDFDSCEGLCRHLNYEFEKYVEPKHRASITFDLTRDLLARTYRRYRTGIGNYPARLNWS